MRTGADLMGNDMVYPNPATDKININVPAGFNGNVSVVSINGQVLKNMQINSEVGENIQLNIADLATGIYTVNLNSASGLITNKIVVE